MSLALNGGFTYTPTLGFAGVATFTYRANDNPLPSNLVTVTLTVSQTALLLYLPLIRK